MGLGQEKFQRLVIALRLGFGGSNSFLSGSQGSLGSLERVRGRGVGFGRGVWSGFGKFGGSAGKICWGWLVRDFWGPGVRAVGLKENRLKADGFGVFCGFGARWGC